MDFRHYKPGTVRRRTLRRMTIHRLESPDQYARYLRANREELDLLFNDILIHVTSFFREPATFAAIVAHVLPAILRGRSQDDPVRVWVPGCATGEEAYSIAICMLEFMRQTGVELGVQLFGTDLSEVALEQARSGVYPQSIEADVSPERLRRFFVQTNGMYQIARSVRDMCIFAKQNVTKDPPFSKLDMVICRNVLIYLGHTLQSKVMRLFHYALKPTGFLVLGASETVGEATELFAPVDRQQKVYSRKPTPAIITTDFGAYEEAGPRDVVHMTSAVVGLPDNEKRVDQLLLARYTPPAVVVDADLRVLQFRGDPSPYLRLSPGNASLNFTKLARGSLGAEVRKLIRAPALKAGPVKGKLISLSGDGAERMVALSIVPVEGATEAQYIVIFEEAPAKAPDRPARRPVDAKGSDLAGRTRELEEELASTKRYLHSVIEEQEAATEELKSAHEEMQSSNEELQSTNEELLTAKEELQSTNEELTTVNDEMQSRNAELQHINNDLINLLSSVNIPIVMLGNDLHIRRFTPHAEKILNLLPSDVGRPINDFRLKINVPDLEGLCQVVIDTLVPRDREVQDTEGRLYSMWVRPYRTADNRIDGVVLALFDITDRKQAAEARYRRMFEMAKDGIVIADAVTGEIVDSNPHVTRMFGYQRPSLVGVRFWESDLFRGSELNESFAGQLHEHEAVHRSLQLPSESGEQIAVDVVASLYSEGDRRVIQFNIRDMSGRRRMEGQLSREGELSQKIEAVGRLAGGVAHDFNNILTAIGGYSDLLQQRLEGDKPGMQMLGQIRGGADRAVALTRQLLAFGHKQVASPALLEVNGVVGDMRQILSLMMTKGVELAMELAPEAGHVWADRAQIEQVVLSLALNARDAMPDGGTVSVATANVDVDPAYSETHPTVPIGEYVAITVRDNGAGMDLETQAHLFEPFFTTRPRGLGAGLGLATVQSIARESGGYISAYSQLGVGSTFTFYQPRVQDGRAGVESAVRNLEELRGSETVLLVEDDHAVRDLARRFLELQGYR
ncbi:MAG TPA: CheR family methyltransferase, partial [Candidatus Sulfopaludibacter sp.]|nr:CheR family methyltransferase [Candidatus Sulfopaludibacter sp.]